ncbi:MAG TPA: zf-HC2 domain-containing protein [Gemmatimonadota bacterium]|nr:zf-HC2 domain-containing protein [Gemmatimonadota bacterium]
MSDHRTDRLSEYIDGELAAAERRELEAHLAKCQECAATLEQLRRVRERAASLKDRPPADDLWSGIAERIEVRSAGRTAADLGEFRERKAAGIGRRRLSFSMPQLAAASLALMVLSGGMAWLVTRATAPQPEAVVVESPAESMAGAEFVSTEYDAAIVELQRVLDANRDQLDTTTVRVIEENLRIIDRAIAQAQQAIALDPASSYLHEYLAGTLRQKLEFLRQAAQMAGAVS